jgi:hypothetical protein
MLICTHCGKTYEGALPTCIEIHGHTSLGNTIEEIGVDTLCPHCKKGELVVATKCRVCDDYFYDENDYKVCDDCLDKNKTLETALAIGEENTTDVYVNGFVKTLLGDKRINDILVEYVRKTYTDSIIKKRIVDYCEEDPIYFAEWVEYEANHKE